MKSFKPFLLTKKISRPLKIVAIVLLAVSIPILAIELFLGVYNLGVRYWLLPQYQRPQKIDWKEVCLGIHNSNLQKLCFSKIKDESFQIDLNSIKPGCESLGCGGWYDEEKMEKTLMEGSENPSLCEEIHTNPAFQYYCFALIKNPYYCSKITVIDLFLDPWIRDYCYLDAALAWGDPNLCKKVKDAQDRDFCYLRLTNTQVDIK